MESGSSAGRASLIRQLVEEGYIASDEYGIASLTEKGMKRARACLKRLKYGDDLLLELLVLEGHRIPVSL